MFRGSVWRFLLFLLILAVLSGLLYEISSRYTPKRDVSVEETPRRQMTVLLDPGHGGEDAGASSALGVREKDLNLALATALRERLAAAGINVLLTREEDVLLYDRTVDYTGRKKHLDLEARRSMAEAIPSCVFVSIHMNSFPQTQYKGLQVWYTVNDPEAQVLASRIQSTVRERLQPENSRAPKAATSSIYLLHHLAIPAVLVECGFLSNPEEAALLSDPAYREALADCLCEALLIFDQNRTV